VKNKVGNRKIKSVTVKEQVNPYLGVK